MSKETYGAQRTNLLNVLCSINTPSFKADLPIGFKSIRTENKSVYAPSVHTKIV